MPGLCKNGVCEREDGVGNVPMLQESAAPYSVGEDSSPKSWGFLVFPRLIGRGRRPKTTLLVQCSERRNSTVAACQVGKDEVMNLTEDWVHDIISATSDNIWPSYVAVLGDSLSSPCQQ